MSLAPASRSLFFVCPTSCLPGAVGSLHNIRLCSGACSPFTGKKWILVLSTYLLWKLLRIYTRSILIVTFRWKIGPLNWINNFTFEIQDLKSTHRLEDLGCFYYRKKCLSGIRHRITARGVAKRISLGGKYKWISQLKSSKFLRFRIL